MLKTTLATVAIAALSSAFACADVSQPKHEVKRVGPRHTVVVLRTDRPTTIEAPYALTGQTDRRQETHRSMGHMGPRHSPVFAR